MKLGAYDTVPEIDPKTLQKVLRFRVLSDPPAHWGIVIGVIAHDLRSALNCVVHALAKPDSDGLSFPIYRRKADYVTPRGKKRISARDEYLAGVAERPFREIIDSYQPYQRGKAADTDLLALLSFLADADKHGGAMVGLASPSTQRIIVTPLGPYEYLDTIFFAPNQRLYDGIELARVTIRPPDRQVAFEGRTGVDIAFGERRITPRQIGDIERHVIEIIERLNAALVS